MKQSIAPGDLFKAPRVGRTHVYRSGSFDVNPTGFSLFDGDIIFVVSIGQKIDDVFSWVCIITQHGIGWIPGRRLQNWAQKMIA